MMCASWQSFFGCPRFIITSILIGAGHVLRMLGKADCTVKEIQQGSGCRVENLDLNQLSGPINYFKGFDEEVGHRQDVKRW